MNKYYKKIEELIVETEANKKSRAMIDNHETLVSYWQIGKIIVQMQTDNQIKYVSKIVKEWSFVFVEKYGRSYDYTNLTRMKKFYCIFENIATVSQLSVNWSHIVEIIPIKKENVFIDSKTNCWDSVPTFLESYG